ncbi:hypothetical protein QBC42DRAFT_214514 [Cladorrhinum samala]|uniref:Up-regulated in Daf-2 domain-containing protein n=1 Tax=Cladorrhinum samala TaxID=585594 RepID=A0AAV9H9P0_9PEZI|nr:hypothetical protein QBC42DRAFT_214514 [Cladorrhinum samala]
MTKRTAYVAIRNEKSEPLVAVGVKHKYSDDYTNDGEWAIVQPGELSGERLEVEYNTGFLTTGVDWWAISWYSPDMKTVYYSNPNNFRGIIDGFENLAPDVIAAAASAVAALIASPSGPGAVGAAVAASAAAKATTSALFNSEGTVGFKRHMLTSDDEGRTTEIVIRQDNTIEFRSSSGNSETVTSTKNV